MLATTWVQVVKAFLLLGGGAILCFLVLSHFGFRPTALFSKAAEIYGAQVLAPGTPVFVGHWDALSLALALMFGTAGMPHILMRIYTVPNVKIARRSVFYATCLIGVFHLMVFVIGFGCMVLVGRDAVKLAGGGGNMAAPLLAAAVGGQAFFGFLCAVAFATMLAVVAGLTISGAAALSHDLWEGVLKRGKADDTSQVKAARVSACVIGLVSVLLSIAFENQNVAFVSGLAFSVACSTNFPALILGIFFKRFTTAGAVSTILTGTVCCVVMIFCSPTIQVDVLKHSLDAVNQAWWFVPLRNPAIFSMPLSFMVGIVVSLMGREAQAADLYGPMQRRMLLGPDSIGL
jgi:cation/acetate symporter